MRCVTNLSIFLLLMMKWIIGVVVVLVIAGAGLWWSGALNQFMSPSKPAPVVEQATTTPQQQTPQAVNDLPTATSDTSDAAMVQDTAAIDAQFQSLSGDSSSMEQSFNDKQTAQEY